MNRVLPRYAVWGVVVLLALVFVFLRSGLDVDYVIPKRLTRLAAMIIGGVAIA
jgi:iron complex transport system permease protein